MQSTWGRLAQLRLFARCPGAEDLCEHDPAIAELLSVHWHFRPFRYAEWATIRNLLGQPRRRLLEFLGLPPRQAIRRVLRLGGSWYGTPETARAVITLLRTPGFADAVAVNSTVAEWRYDVVETLARAPRVAAALETTTFSASTWGSASFRRAIAEVVALAAAFDRPELLSAVVRHGKEWMVFGDILLNYRLPEAPWDGVQGIVPLRTVAELRKEGVDMQNCAGNPATLASVGRGEMFIYRVTEPVRATLGIAKTDAGYEFEGPLGPRNTLLPKAVSAQIRSRVHGVEVLPSTHERFR